MAVRTHIPGSAACGEWETLLADALDGLLQPADEAKFTAHKAACPACAALHEEARKGREWLQFLSPQPEPPMGLLEKILAQTGPGHAGAAVGAPMPVAAGTAPGFVPPIWQQPGFFRRMRMNMQPRLLMTAAMAFFSIALTLNVTGVRLWSVRVTPLKLADLRPQALRSYMERQLTMASVPIVRYYDHSQLVYEVESQVRELRGESDDDSTPQPKQEQPVTPGETRRENRNRGNDAARELGGTEHQRGAPALGSAGDGAGGILESSQDDFAGSGVPVMSRSERNRQWIA